MYKQPETEHNYSRENMRRELLQKSYENDRAKSAKKKQKQKIFGFVAVGISLIVAGTILAIHLLGGNSLIKRTPGTITYDESVTEEEKEWISARFDLWREFTESDIYSDLTISAKTSYRNEEDFESDNQHTVIYDIELPTVDFYSSELNITQAEAETSENINWISLRELTFEDRIVSIDNNYWLDTFDAGARYRHIIIEGTDEHDIAVFHICATKFTADEEPEDGKVSPASFIPTGSSEYLSFAQTGVTALTRAMTITLNNKSKANGRGSYFADNIKDFLSTKDLTHISNEASFTDDCKGSTGTMMLCSDWRSLDSITAIGTDIVELTGNHNNNYGTAANIKTIEKYHELGMQTFGGGINETEAAKPLEISKKGQNITLLGYNHSTSSKANGELANGDKPGANGYSEEKAKADIAAAKARGDFIIVDVQYSECYSYPDGYTEMPSCDSPISGQQSFFRNLIDLGADLVIGTQAHHPQTFELYKGKPIYYGLGNLFFDQTYWPGTQRGYILTHYFYQGKLLNTRISPTWYDEKHQVYLTDEQTSEKFIKRLMESSPRGE